MKLSLTLVAVMLLLLPQGCVNRDEELREEVIEETGGELDTSMTQIMSEEDPEVQSGPTAAVVIDENTIGIETELQPGLALFTVRNSGLKDHSLAIEGAGGSWRLEGSLAPEETGNLEVDLQEGTYRVYDPLDETLAVEVTVAPPPE